MAPSESSPQDPTRVAVIDIGTNSTRLLLADVVGDRVEELERISTITRLGRGVDYSGVLSSEAIEDVCRAIASYLDLITEMGASRTVVVATSAVRDAENGEAFAAELRERFDLSTSILSGDEEARLTYRGAISHRDGDESLLVCDIGGGSTEIIVGRGPEMLFHVSMQAGVVRHTERMLPSDPPEAGELEQLADDVRRLIVNATAGFEIPTIDRAVGVAGTPSSTAAIDLALDPYDPEAVEGHLIPFGAAQTLLSRMAGMALAERRQVVGLHPDRAQAIVAGLVILIEIMRAFDLDEVEVSEHDILYGCAIEAAG